MKGVLNVLQNVFLLLLLLNSQIYCKAPCEQVNPCKCEGVEKTIDLAPLAIAAAQQPPRFKNISYTENNTTSYFFYHPCNAFKMGNGSCQNEDVAICEYSPNNTTPYNSRGAQSNASFEFPDNKAPLIKYTSGINTTILTLNCTPDSLLSNLTVDKIVDNIYYMTLHSQCSCFNGCGMKKPSDRLSAGSVLLIMFFVGVAVYLLGGMLYKNCYIGATGFEVIPNFEFWIDFPFLVRDGVIFALTCCRTGRTYDSI